LHKSYRKTGIFIHLAAIKWPRKMKNVAPFNGETAPFNGETAFKDLFGKAKGYI
jgi:hypothetical protein